MLQQFKQYKENQLINQIQKIQQAMQALNQNQPNRRIQTSFSLFNTELNLALQRNHIHEIAEMLKANQPSNMTQKLSKALTYYQVLKNGQDNTSSQLNQCKWAQKDPVTQSQINGLIIPLSRMLSLDEVMTFELIDQYFLSSIVRASEFSIIQVLEKEINETAYKLNNFFSPPNISVYQGSMNKRQLEVKQRELQLEFDRAFSKVINGAQTFYFQERQFLLDSIYFVISIAIKHDEIKKFVLDLVKNGLYDNLVKSLSSAMNVMQGELQFVDQQREIVLSLQREEIYIYKILFGLTQNHLYPTKDNLIQYFNYQNQTEYKGFLHQKLSQNYTLSREPAVYLNQSIIQDLTILASLNMLGINLLLRNDQDNEVKKNIRSQLVDPAVTQSILKTKLDARNSIVCIAYTELLNMITKQNKENTVAKDSFFMEYLKEMVDGQIFIKDILAEQKTQFQLTIKNFLDLILSYLKQNKMLNEIVYAKTLQLYILKDPQTLKETWAKDSNLKIRMFKEELNNPLQNKLVFLKLMLTLCGNQQYKYGHKVYTYLRDKHNEMDDSAQPSLLVGLMSDLIREIDLLDVEGLGGDDIQPFMDCIILFSVLIRQYPMLYEELNSELKFMLNFDSQREAHNRGSMDYDDMQFAEPMLVILIRAFHLLIKMDIQMSLKACQNILNAVTSIYTHLNLQKEIILCFKAYVSPAGNLIVTDYALYMASIHESDSKVYKATSAYLKFLQRIFEKDFPQMGLDIPDRAHLDKSFLNEGLVVVYKYIMEHYYHFEFKDTGEYATFTKRLFKLTHALLSKFQDIPQQQKVQICQPYPKFNFLYKLIVSTLNHINVESILISVLDLAEKKTTGLSHNLGEQKIISNKFWLVALDQGTNIVKQRSKLAQLITSSLKCLNVLMKLVQLNVQLLNTPQSQENFAGVLFKPFYIQRLNCVQKMTQLITDPSNSPFLMLNNQSQSILSGDLSYSLFNYISFYVNPDQLQPNISQMQVEALKFFTLSAQIWDKQSEKTRPQLYVHLQNNIYSSGSHSIQKFINTFIQSQHSMKTLKSYQYMSGLFDLLIISCHSQQQFAEHIFKDATFQKQFKNLVMNLKGKEIENGMKEPYQHAFVRDVCCKTVILISQMSIQRVYNEFLKILIAEGLLKAIHSGLLKGYLFDQFNQQLSFEVVPEFTYGDDNDQEIFAIDSSIANNNNVGRKHFEVCQTYTVAYYYMKLLQNEYAIDASSKEVKKAIADLFQIKDIFDKKQSQDLDKCFNELWGYNETFKNNSNERNKEVQQEAFSYINTMGFFEDYQERDRVQNKLISQDGTIYIHCLDGIESFRYLQNVEPYYHIMVEPLNFRAIGKFGMNFIVPAEELYFLIKDQFYMNSDLNALYRCAAQKYNLALSLESINYLLTEAKMDFFLSIGKTKMRESIQKNIDHEYIITTSLYTIVGHIDEQINDNVISSYQNKLIDLMTQYAAAQYKQVLGFKEKPHDFDGENIPVNHFKVKQAEVDLEFLSLILGVINSQTQIGQIKQGCLNALDNLIIGDFIKNLPEILQQQFSQICVQQRQMQRAFRLESEQLTANLFTQLVQQCFQVCFFLKQVKQNDKKQAALSQENQLSRDQISQNLELNYLKILSQICALMQSGYCFQQCLTILAQALSLLSPANIKLFMENGSTQPLRVIVQRFINPNVSVDESIQICKFFISYASIHKGAVHLFLENVLHNISINTCLLKVNQQDFYVVSSENGENRRNPVHILWCLSLVLIRTLNDYLIGQPDYFKAIIKSIKLFENRLSIVFGIGKIVLAQEQQAYGQGTNTSAFMDVGNVVRASNSLCLALYEEIELLTAALLQVFNHADKWAALNYPQFVLIKDLYLYSVCHLFSKQRVRCGFGITPTSSTEYGLNQIWPGKEEEKDGGALKAGGTSDLAKWAEGNFRDDLFNMTGFELKVELSKMKAFLNIQTSILSVSLLNKEKGKDNELICTWAGKSVNLASPQQLRDASQSSIIYGQGVQRNQEFENDTMVKIAYDNNFYSIEYIFMIFQQLLRKKDSFARFVKQLSNFDEWLNDEYLGLNQFLGSLSMAEIIQYYDYSLQIGVQLECLLIEKLIQVFDVSSLEYQSTLTEAHIVGMCDSLISLIRSLDGAELKASQYKNVVGFLIAMKERRQIG